MTIDKTAIIYDGAQVHEECEIGPYAIIGANVKIGRGTKIGAHAVIDGHSTIGEDCHIFAGATIGLEPQDLGYKGEPTGVTIGNRCTIREYVTIHRATKAMQTRIGDDCFLMNYVHIAHDCQVGNGVIMANNASLSGHVQVGDLSVLSGFLVFHQNCRIGRLVMISPMSGSRVDIPPFAMTDGRPLIIRGINVIGMRRAKIQPAQRSAIKEAYRLLYRSGLNQSQALERIEAEIEQYDEIKELVDFIRSSKRGVVSRGFEDTSEFESMESEETVAV